MVNTRQRPPRVATTAANSRPKPSIAPDRTDATVTAFMRDLKHPMKHGIEALRAIILDASPEIHEGIKWNAPSFRTTEYFATMHLREKGGRDRVSLILHTGAKAKARAQPFSVADPLGLLQWLDKDRCIVVFETEQEIEARHAALQAIIREWMRHL